MAAVSNDTAALRAAAHNASAINGTATDYEGPDPEELQVRAGCCRAVQSAGRPAAPMAAPG